VTDGKGALRGIRARVRSDFHDRLKGKFLGLTKDGPPRGQGWRPK
jgi:hypothetical protein